MSHYYINDNQVKDDFKTIKIEINNCKMTFKTNAGVFSKDRLDFGSNLLIKSVEINDNIKTLADLGGGYGPIGISLAKLNTNLDVSLYEINERAVALAKENVLINDVSNVNVYHNNILDNVMRTFDLIVTNPPIRAGKETVFNFYQQAYSHLNNEGFLYVVIQKKQGAESSFKFLTNLFDKSEIIVKNKGYWIIKSQKYNFD